MGSCGRRSTLHAEAMHAVLSRIRQSSGPKTFVLQELISFIIQRLPHATTSTETIFMHLDILKREWKYESYIKS